ncbi:hypothetical protein GQ55_6G068800 [Panicum hallii var. hallii]|uniref:NB-ARC domain-containing protein n=1 Tax=Panicum hallii var. hallii TaxID=1504633 RepID=A0A2T7D4V2_9POAL|nr:hypothetical protein GQ55_6G068800 [Panicum hallii var. hallii]
MAEKILVSASMGVMNSLLGKLATLMGEKYAKLKDVQKQVAFLHEELSSMGALQEDLADMEGLDNQTSRRAIKIQELKARVQEASAQRMRYRLDDCKSRSGNVAVDPRMTALYTESSRLVGIDGSKEEVINLLTKQVDDASVQKLRVVSILGLGGLGKTTHANQVYGKLGESFGCKAFVSVSQRPDMVVLWYLVVVDDLWDASAWEFIKRAFPEGHYGSNVLTTTRIERVAVTCCNFQREFVYRMKPLDDHNSSQLFYEPSDKILQKSGGLPLAIISIASLLASQSNRSVSQWNCILNSLRSDLRSNPSLEGMRQILNLSYTHLLHHLKTCLLYIRMSPEDHDIDKDHPVMQWVAEGSYFNKLVNRSMIIQLVEHRAWNMERLYHRVHDMVLDLIVSKSAEENFLGVVENLETITRRQQCKTRRLSLQLDEAELGKIAPCMGLPHVRSLFIFGLPHRSIGLLELKFLHVLFVCKVDGLDLTPIGKLSQLRYLYVKSYHRSSKQLPRQICGLHHLETLVTDGVFVSIAYHDGISKMKSLHTLDCFDPSKQSLDNLMALGELLNLRELHFCITDYNFPTMETHKDALLYSIERLLNRNLRHLTLHLQFPFPRLPVWVGQLSTLSSLEIHLDELCKDDVAVHAELPVLAHLVLWAGYVPDKAIARRAGIAFHFQAGSVPKVETLRFQSSVHEVKTCGVRLAGIERLKNLKRVAIRLGFFGPRSEESDVPTIEAAIRSFFEERHPGCPTIHITSYLYTYDD